MSSNNFLSQNKNNLIVFAFHKMQTQFSYGANNYSPRRFEKLLNYLTENDYSFISLSELGGEIEDKSVLITFDDGYAHLFKHLPRFIDKYSIKPIIFIPTKYIGHANNWDYSHIFQNCPHMTLETIKELSELGVDFGSHSHSHCDLTSVTFNQLTIELKHSKDIIEEIISKEITSLCYPFGRYNKNVVDQALSLGYQYGFTMKFPNEDDSSLTIGRYPIYGFDSLFAIKQKIEHGIFYHCERIKSSSINKLSGGTVLLNKLRNNNTP